MTSLIAKTALGVAAVILAFGVSGRTEPGGAYLVALWGGMVGVALWRSRPRGSRQARRPWVLPISALATIGLAVATITSDPIQAVLIWTSLLISNAAFMFGTSGLQRSVALWAGAGSLLAIGLLLVRSFAFGPILFASCIANLVFAAFPPPEQREVGVQ